MNLKNRPGATRPSRSPIIAGIAVLVLAVGIGACGGADSGLSEAAERGKTTANGNGCASCHGAQGQGGVGPSWKGLAGSDVELSDGTTVVADDDYLHRSILDPGAEAVAGYTLAMPANGLSEEQAADVVAYIKELAADAA